MNARLFLSVNIIVIALVLAFAPARVTEKGEALPDQQASAMAEGTRSIEVDKAARIINQRDSGYQFIDVRPRQEFLAANLPGSINIPFDELLDPRWQGYLRQDARVNVLYSNGDYHSNIAVSLLNSKGYGNLTTLAGGLNEWYAVVMYVEFKGERLTARENALIENRLRAKELFTQLNSLPDSLKSTFLEAKLLEEKKLDGGCE